MLVNIPLRFFPPAALHMSLQVVTFFKAVFMCLGVCVCVVVWGGGGGGSCINQDCNGTL